MSTFTAFERAKLSRFINVYGNSFTFKRNVKNDCGEPTDEIVDVAKIDGVYHEASSIYAEQTSSDGSVYSKIISPMILCLQSVETAKIMPDDYVEIQDRKFVVIKLNNVGKFGYAWDISLRMEEDGSNS